MAAPFVQPGASGLENAWRREGEGKRSLDWCAPAGKRSWLKAPPWEELPAVARTVVLSRGSCVGRFGYLGSAGGLMCDHRSLGWLIEVWLGGAEALHEASSLPSSEGAMVRLMNARRPPFASLCL